MHAGQPFFQSFHQRLAHAAARAVDHNHIHARTSESSICSIIRVAAGIVKYYRPATSQFYPKYNPINIERLKGTALYYITETG
jgi:hypothetical protein